ncbi:hypothetical protein Hanom_Chr04g00293711 [Helianthus anomalus]
MVASAVATGLLSYCGNNSTILGDLHLQLLLDFIFSLIQKNICYLINKWIIVLKIFNFRIAGFGPETFRLDPYVNVSGRKFSHMLHMLMLLVKLMVRKQAYSNPIAHPVSSKYTKFYYLLSKHTTFNFRIANNPFMLS